MAGVLPWRDTGSMGKTGQEDKEQGGCPLCGRTDGSALSSALAWMMLASVSKAHE